MFFFFFLGAGPFTEKFFSLTFRPQFDHNTATKHKHTKLKHNKTKQNETQHNTTQHGTIQYNTIQLGINIAQWGFSGPIKPVVEEANNYNETNDANELRTDSA